MARETPDTDQDKRIGKALGEVFKARRGEKVSQQEIATRAGLSMGIVSQLEQGRKSDPRLTTLMKLAEAYNVPVGELASELADAYRRARPKRKKE